MLFMIALKSCWNYSLQFLGLRDFSLLGICTPLSCFFHHLVFLETLQLRYLQAAFCSTSVSEASAASAAFLCQSKASSIYLLFFPLLPSLCIHWWARCILWNSVAWPAWWWALAGPSGWRAPIQASFWPTSPQPETSTVQPLMASSRTLLINNQAHWVNKKIGLFPANWSATKMW